jgi:hypothetical protein
MSNIEIIVQKDCEFPSILELASVMDAVTEDPVRVEWGNTRDEQHTLRSFPTRNFVLYVKDFPARDRVTSVLGLPLKLEQPVVERAKIVLVNAATYDWRSFCHENDKGPSTKNILLKLVADSLRKGNRPALAEIMEPLFLGSIRLEDVDVLFRLKKQ